MRAHNYCKVCGERNAANVARCSVCYQEMHNNPRTNPVNSASFRSPTLIIFDIDDTILNVSQRYKDARRGNYLNKDGSPKKKSTFETLGKARKRAEEFLFSPDNLRKDTAIPGAIGLVNELASQGHTIAYVTARSAKFRDVTRNQLEDKGFPIFKDESDMELLFLKAKLGESMAQYKEGVYAKLLASYDIRMVFDDMKENLQAAVSQGITGVYPSIQDYTRYQVKSNPSHLVDYHKGQQFVMHEHPDVAGRMMIDPDDEDGRTVAETSSVDVYTGEAKNPPLNCGCGKSPCMTFGGLKNPGDIQSRVESILIKEGGAAGLKPLKAAFPKGTTKAQATAAIAKMSSVYQHPAGDYILKNPGHSGNYMVPRDIHRLGKAADRLEETYEDGQDTPEWWKSKLSVTAKDADTIADSLDFVAENPLPLMGLSVQVKGYRNTAGAFVMKGKKFLILQRSKKETSKHGLWELPGGKVEKGETMRETAVIETQEEAGLDVTLKVNLGPHIDDKKKKVYHAYIATPKKGQKVKLSEEHVSHKWVTPEEVMAMPKKMVSHHLMYFLKKEGETIRSNPPKNKIEKGKKLYEHMNGKAPEKIEKKKIDMGDVWYQVGEGGCWQIGYMSGKETGKTEQKYTHTFNEETKDGNFPKLYATMPENGKPLLIIQGGTWKIRTDDKGVAWIYD